MDTMSEIRRLNLKRLASASSQVEFAEQAGLSTAYLNHLLTGYRNIGEKTARKIERKLGIDLMSLDKNPVATPIKKISGYNNIEPGPDIVGRVPLISWVQAGAWAEVIENHQPGQAEEWRLTTAKVSKNAFALRVKGDSMTNPNGSPSIPEGYIIIVDPHRQAENGDLIVARLDDSMEATFKKLVIDGGLRYLKPLNPAYPVIQINGNCTIVGKVVKVELDL
jgi:SOS-response transcriptional repressor LexA